MDNTHFIEDKSQHKNPPKLISDGCLYQCPSCLTTLVTKNNWYKHISKCLDKNKEIFFPCPDCGLQLPSFGILNKHATYYCKANSQNVGRDNTQRKKLEYLFRCEDCTKLFQNQYEWQQHSIKCGKHKLKKTTHDYPCERCGVKFMEKQLLSMHQLTHCKPKRLGQDVDMEVDGLSYKRFRYQCPCCKKNFYTDNEIDLNDQMKNGLLPNLQCSECGSEFSINEFLGLKRPLNPPQLKRPISDIDVAQQKKFKYQCPGCPEIFTTEKEIDTNAKTNSIFILTCHKCGSEFSANDLLSHAEEEQNVAPDKERTEAAVIDLVTDEEDDNLVEIIELNEEEVDCFTFNSDVLVKNENLTTSEFIRETEIVKTEIKLESYDILVKNEPLKIKEEPHETVETNPSSSDFEVKTEILDGTEIKFEAPKLEIEIFEECFNS